MEGQWMTLDFNKAKLSASPFNIAMNEELDAAALQQEREERRPYLGASGIGSECLRAVQWGWQLDSEFPELTKRKFERGHMFEEITARAFAQAGFRMERGTERTAFSAFGGLFRGHADGIIIEAPEFLHTPCLWEHKAINSTGWKKLERDGLRKAYPQYYSQVSLYQAYLELDDNPAVFTAVNSDSCQILHLLMPFDAEEAQRSSDRAVSVIKAVQAGETLPRITTKWDDWRCMMCQHQVRCWSGE
jgi:hypothetical protein